MLLIDSLDAGCFCLIYSIRIACSVNCFFGFIGFSCYCLLLCFFLGSGQSWILVNRFNHLSRFVINRLLSVIVTAINGFTGFVLSIDGLNPGCLCLIYSIGIPGSINGLLSFVGFCRNPLFLGSFLGFGQRVILINRCRHLGRFSINGLLGVILARFNCLSGLVLSVNRFDTVCFSFVNGVSILPFVDRLLCVIGFGCNCLFLRRFFRRCESFILINVARYFSRFGINGLLGSGFTIGNCLACVMLGVNRFNPVSFGLVDCISLFSRINRCFSFSCFIRNRLFLVCFFVRG